MDELSFIREKLRREMQEAVNSLDGAIVAESESVEQPGLDLEAALRSLTAGMTMKQYMQACLEKYDPSRSE